MDSYKVKQSRAKSCSSESSSSEHKKSESCEGKGVQKNENEEMLRPQKPKYRYGRWEQQQDQIYMKFIIENQQLLASESIRRSTKVFQKLSKLLNYKRSADQCRSHHQKMKRMSRYETIESILTYLGSKYRRKNLLLQMKMERCRDEKDKEKRVPEQRANIRQEETQQKYNISVKAAKKSLNLIVQIEGDLIQKW